METLEQVRECTYAEYKAGFDKDMHDTTEGFVKIGYRLRMAEDTDILRESGYKTMAEFAEAEYHLTRDQVSRFVRINERFSEGGYSPRLKPEYARFGFSKLAIMLTMNDEINTAIPEQATKAEIQELSREIRAEKEISDIEVMLEPKKAELEELENILQKGIYQIFAEHPEEKYIPTMQSLRRAGAGINDKMNAVYDALAPNGYMMTTFRIPGGGKWTMTIKGKEQPVEIVNIRFGGGETYSFEELTETVLMFCPIGAADPGKAWEAVFGKTFPVPGNVQQSPQPEQKKPEVAPEQPKEPEKTLPTAREAAERFAEKMAEKESVPEETEELEYKEPEPVINEPEPEPQEQIPGQMGIGAYPEYLPDNMQREQEPQPEAAPEQLGKTEQEELHQQIYNIINKMQIKILSKKYTDTMELCRQMENLLDRMEELQSET